MQNYRSICSYIVKPSQHFLNWSPGRHYITKITICVTILRLEEMSRLILLENYFLFETAAAELVAQEGRSWWLHQLGSDRRSGDCSVGLVAFTFTLHFICLSVNPCRLIPLAILNPTTKAYFSTTHPHCYPVVVGILTLCR